jgi:hypothetical protein
MKPMKPPLPKLQLRKDYFTLHSGDKTERVDFYESLFLFEVWSHYHIHVCVSDKVVPLAVCVSDRDHFKQPGRGNDADALTISCNNGHAYIFLKQDVTAATMAHEVVHLIHGMLKYHGASLDDDEVFAYHVGYAMEQLNAILTLIGDDNDRQSSGNGNPATDARGNRGRRTRQRSEVHHAAEVRTDSAQDRQATEQSGMGAKHDDRR